MEFETNTQPQSAGGTSDEVRLAATTRKVTLTPIHDNVAPELNQDGSNVGERASDAPIANVPGDVESTRAVPQAPSPVATAAVPAAFSLPKPVKHHSALPFIVLGLISLLVVIGATLFVVLR